MGRQGCRSLLLVMTDMYALFLYAPAGRTMRGDGYREEKKTHMRKPNRHICRAGEEY